MNDVLARPLPPARVRTRVVLLAGSLDALVVLLFAASGRASHDEAFSVGGVLGTAWPFLIATAVAWVALRVWRRPLRLVTGLGVWGITWGLGMALRALTGDGTAVAFMLVALGVLFAGLIGWRLVARFAPSVRSTYPGLSQS